MKVSSIEFHGSPSSDSRADICGRTDMTKLIGAFCNYSNAPENLKEREHSGGVGIDGRIILKGILKN